MQNKNNTVKTRIVVDGEAANVLGKLMAMSGKSASSVVGELVDRKAEKM